jgi:hypothetical protein
MRAIALGIVGVLVFLHQALSQETPRSAESLECSKQADIQGLHGAERAAFRSQCKANAGQPEQQNTQQAGTPAASMTIQECSARYQAAKAAGTLAGRQWLEFRSTECTAADQSALKLVFPNGISPIYAQEPEGQARMHTCVDQYNANKVTNASGGMKWFEAGGGYYSVCNEHLKTVAQNPPPPVARVPVNPPNGPNNQTPDIASLKRGTYVRKETACEIASNSTIMNFDGLQFTQGRFCNAPVKGLRGSSIVVKRLCPSEDGSGEVTQEDTFRIKSTDEFVLTNGAGEFVFHYCAQARLPEIWRNAVPEGVITKGREAQRSKEAGQPAQASLPPVPGPPSNSPLTQEEIDAFRKVIVNWTPPQGAPALEVRIRLKRDGGIDGTPEVLSAGTGAIFEAAKESAVRTVLQAQPFKMFRPESYDAWKDMIVTFEAATQAAQPPQEMQSVCSAKYEAAKAAGTIGTISQEDFLRVCAVTIIVPDTKGSEQAAAKQPTGPTNVSPVSPKLLLRPGTYVDKKASCAEASMATTIHFNGRIFSGGHGYSCAIPIKNENGSLYTCLVEGQKNTWVVKSRTEVVLTNQFGVFNYRYCEPLPSGMTQQ